MTTWRHFKTKGSLLFRKSQGLVPLEISNAIGVKELMPLLGFGPGVGEVTSLKEHLFDGGPHLMGAGIGADTTML